jgi:O-acetyl-ADP-ribose deacetylase (regulator of RNase III)
MLSSTNSFAKSIRLVPYGVLGQQLTAAEGKFVNIGQDPKELASICITDPAGLPYIRSGPRGAGGASGAIYSWLGINTQGSFPSAVTEAIRAPGDAKFHAYPDKTRPGARLNVIHTVGPDFRQGSQSSRSEAVEQLARSYLNIFREFVSSSAATAPQQLRLLPVSGGVFAGPWGSYIATMTFEAINRGHVQLTTEEQGKLAGRQIDLCIFAEAEIEEFVSAGFAR